MRLSIDGVHVTDLRSLGARRGDVIVVECVDRLSAAQTDRVRRHVQRLAPGRQVDVIDGRGAAEFSSAAGASA